MKQNYQLSNGTGWPVTEEPRHLYEHRCSACDWHAPATELGRLIRCPVCNHFADLIRVDRERQNGGTE